ncbi:MAG TPA: hypothetical protein VK249_12320 [Anaerolineales bacterium]|nr:hypothetical protein [Anaerolineales bacterium]
MDRITHLVIKISDTHYGLSGTVLRHNLIALEHGAVWIGKPDHPLASSFIGYANEQIDQGIATYLFVIDPDRSNPTAYEAALQAAISKPPQEKYLIPPFYKELKILHRMKAWFKVGPFHAFNLEQFPILDELNTRYDLHELKAIRGGKRTHRGGFAFDIPEPIIEEIA